MMQPKIYHKCLEEARRYDDQNTFLKAFEETALGYVKSGDIDMSATDLVDWLRQIWKAAHRSVKDICRDAGLTQKALAEFFGIPGRTVGNWCTGVNECPEYTRIMMQELLHLVSWDQPVYNLIYSVRGRTEVVLRGSYSEVSNAEKELRQTLRAADPEGVESDCYIRSDAQLEAEERRRDLWSTLSEEDKHDYVIVNGRKYIRKLYEANH